MTRPVLPPAAAAGGGSHPLPGAAHVVARAAGEVVLRNRLIELVRNEPATSSVYALPLLVVPAWIMQCYVLDATSHTSLVRYLVERGHVVYTISWTDPRADDHTLALDDYLRLGVMDAIDAVIRHTGAPRLNACGYGMGGVLLAIAAAAMARNGDGRLASMTLLAAPVDVTGADATRDNAAGIAGTTCKRYRKHSCHLRQLIMERHPAGAAVALRDLHVPIFAVGCRADRMAPWRAVHAILAATDAEVTFVLAAGAGAAHAPPCPGTTYGAFQLATRSRAAAGADPDRWRELAEHREGSWWPAYKAWLAPRAGPALARPAAVGAPAP
jgi:polyhydroxyalkanoate synthase